MSIWRVLLPALLLVCIGGYWFAKIPANPTPAGPVSQARFQPGPFAVASESVTLVDRSRPTQAYNDYPGAPTRTLETEIWRPADLTGPGPLVIYSHGFMSYRQEGLYLDRFLASHGYTVVAPDYPLSGMRAPDGPLMIDVVNQPGDISFLIDTMLRRSADPDDPLYQTIDPDRIAVAGVSLGGLTTLLAAFHRQLRDPRISAAISVAGPGSFFTEDLFAGSDVPLLLIYGNRDAIVDYETNALALLAMNPGAILVTLDQASHAAFAQPASTVMRFIDNPDGIGCRVVTEYLDVDVAKANLAFMAQLGDREDGINGDGELAFCTTELIPRAMQAARQHMFTTLAVHAFLDSLFAADEATRREARHYLLSTLAEENGSEVATTSGQAQE